MLNVLQEFGGRYLNLVIYLVATILLSAALTWVCVRVLPRLGLLDIPRGRHDHAKPTPRGGGVAIIIAFFVIGFVLALNNGGNSSLLLLLCKFAVPSAILMVTGLLDDRYELPSIVKLLAQIIVGIMIYYFGGGLYSFMGIPVPVYVGLPVTIVWAIGIINAFNLIDGLDGLAAGLGVVSSFVLTVWGIASGGSPEYIALTMIFGGACLGFLYFNFAPAKIFMGDTGSMFLGLFFAYICSKYASRSVTISSLLVPLLAIGVPVIDVFLAIWRRLARKICNPEASGIMSGDHDHLHHRIMGKTKSKSRTAILLYLFMAFVGIAAVGAAMLKNFFSGAIYIVLLAGLFVVIRLADIELLDSFGCIVRGLRRPSHRFMLVIVHPLIDYILISVAYLIAYIIFFEFEPEFPGLLGYIVFCMPFLIVLYISDVYRTYWLRAGLNRYYRLLNSLMLGGILSVSLLFVLDRGWFFFDLASMENLYGGFFCFFMLVLILVSGERFLVRYLEGFGVRALYLRVRAANIPMQNIVLVGGGVTCRLFILNLFCRHYLNLPVNIRGIVDDDPAIRKLNIYGFDVLGSTSELERIYERTPFDMLIVTTKLSETATERVKSFAVSKGVKLGVFSTGITSCQPEELAGAMESSYSTAHPEVE